MAVRGGSATACEAKVCRRSFPRATNSGPTDAGPCATSRCDEHTPNQRRAGNCSSLWQLCRVKRSRGDILGRPHSLVQSSLRRFHVHLGHPENNVLLRHLRHARDATNLGSCTKLRMLCLRSCQTPSCGTDNIPRLKTSLLSKALPRT